MNSKPNIALFSDLLFCIVIFLYTFSNFLKLLNLSSNIILGFCILLSILSFLIRSYLEKNLFESYIKNKFLLISLVLLPVFFMVINQNYENEFIAFILIISLSFFAIFKDLNSYLLAILFKVFFYVVLFGIILGVLEYYFFETNYFNDVVNNYPYSSSGVKKSFSGFMYNYNSVTYFVICYMAILSIHRRTIRDYVLPFGVLLFMFSKLMILFISIIAVAKILHGPIRLFSLAALVTSYLIMSNFVIVESGSYPYPSYYFREIIFTFMNWDLVVGLFGWLKQQGFYELAGGTTNYIEFTNKHGLEPHSSIISLGLMGGLTFLALFAINIIILSCKILSSESIYNNVIIFSASISFLVELINWDFYSSFYFWIVFFYMTKLTLYPNDIQKNTFYKGKN